MGSHVDADHPALVALADEVCAELLRFRDRLDRVDHVDHEQHRVYLARAERLEGHLRGALLLTRTELHASSLALVRTALEHQLLDRLIHLGNRYIETTRPVDDNNWLTIQEAYERQETRWSRSLAEPPTRERNGCVTFVFRGIADRDDDPATTQDLLHPLFFEIDKYSPTIGRPSDQAYFDDGFVGLEHRKARARENRDRWHSWLRWDGLRRNLELNGITTGRDLVAIDVHYRFLSGFTHATNAAYEAAFGRWGSISDRGYEHFAEELVHLYVATLGAAELTLMVSMEDRPPPVRIDGRAEAEDLIARARGAAAPLWFVGGAPSQFDRVGEMNRRHFRAHRDGVPPPPPGLIVVDDDEIPYYADPLDRLRRMHQSFTETMTGDQL